MGREVALFNPQKPKAGGLADWNQDGEPTRWS